MACTKEKPSSGGVKVSGRHMLAHVAFQQVYHGGHYVLLLASGDKSTQARDIRKARELARNYAE